MKREKAVEELGSSTAFWIAAMSKDRKKRQHFATPPEVSVELSTFVEVQIIESE